MKRKAWLLVFAAILMNTGWAQKVKVVYDHTVDFSRFHTYAWGHQITDLPPNSLITNQQLFEQRLKTNVDSMLKQKGLTLVGESSAADLILTYHGTLDLQSSTQSVNPGSPQDGTKFEQVWVVSQIAGTLFVDISDSRTNQRVWRGTAIAVLNPQKQEERLRKVAQRMFKDFPPKSK